MLRGTFASQSCGQNRYLVANITNPDTGLLVSSNRCQTQWSGYSNVFCCYCPVGKYAPNGIDISSDSDCVSCPAGTFMNHETLTTFGSCAICPAGQYQSKTGSESCSHCPPGETTFTQNQLQSPSNSFSVGSLSSKDCVPIPSGYLLRGYITYKTVYDSGTGYSTGGNNINYYYSACSSFGKVLPPDSPLTGGLNTDSQCVFCLSPTAFFLAGGLTTLNTISMCPPTTSCFTSYVYGPGSYSQSAKNAEGALYNLGVYNKVYSAQCVGSCPSGTGITTVDTVESCSTCLAVLGQYSSGKSQKCQRCDKFHYPPHDGSSSCRRCPFPYNSRWNLAAAAAADSNPQQFAGDRFAVQNYARSVLQYVSCEDPSQGPALCICASSPTVIVVCGVLFLFFVSCLFFFTLCSVGPAPRPAVEVSKSPGAVGVDLGLGSDVPVEISKSTSSDATDTAPGGIKAAPLAGWKVLLGLMMYITIPLFDSISDLAFIISQPFYSLGLFVPMVIFFCAPSLFFFKTLLDRKASPRFYLVEMPTYLIFDKYDSLYKSILGIFVLIPFLLLNSPTLVPWVVLGCILYSTKAFSIRPIANLWLSVWTGAAFAPEGTKLREAHIQDRVLAHDQPIDEKILNESLYSHAFIETGPILVIQILNNLFSSSWTPLGLFSVAFSVFNALSCLYRVLYYRLYLRIKMSEIPVDLTVFGFTLLTSRIDGDGPKGHGQHRLSLTRTMSGVTTTVVDDWVDKDGRVHREEITSVVLKHVIEELIFIKAQLETMQAQMRNTKNTNSAPSSPTFVREALEG